MIRAFARQLDAHGRVTSVADVSQEEGLRLLPQRGYQVWFDLLAPSDDE
ncbi:MAG: hypothetical protein HYR71_06845 [Chloroflexi bacterium]|nr:hypothetical protein [Chloroflexota bacterium]